MTDDTQSQSDEVDTDTDKEEETAPVEGQNPDDGDDTARREKAERKADGCASW